VRWHQQSRGKGGARLRRLASVTSAKPPFAISGDAVGHVSSDQDTIRRNGSLPAMAAFSFCFSTCLRCRLVGRIVRTVHVLKFKRCSARTPRLHTQRSSNTFSKSLRLLQFDCFSLCTRTLWQAFPLTTRSFSPSLWRRSEILRSEIFGLVREPPLCPLLDA